MATASRAAPVVLAAPSNGNAGTTHFRSGGRAYPRMPYPAGAALFQQGEVARFVFVVESGLVKLTRSTANGRATIVGLLGRDAGVGIESAAMREPHTATASALSDTTAIRISAAELESLVRAHDDVSWWLHRHICCELDRCRRCIADRTCLSARERLDGLLAELSAQLPNDGGFPIPLRDWELAQVLGITPQYVSRLTHELRDLGQLERRGNRWWCVTSPHPHAACPD